MPARIILLRHGETDWNRERRYLSFTDVDINATGRAQAAAARIALAGEEVVKVYASDRKRALTTAGIVFDAQAVETCVELREMHFGLFEGLRHEDVVARYRPQYEAWINDPARYPVPLGESFGDFRARVVGKIESIARAHQGQSAAVVTHGGVIRMFLFYILKPAGFWDIKMAAPGSIVIVEADENMNFTLKQYKPEGEAWPKK